MGTRLGHEAEVQVSVTPLVTCRVPHRPSRQPDPQTIFSPGSHGTITPMATTAGRDWGARVSCPLGG